MAPNILLVVLDTVRYRSLQTGGELEKTAPFLSELAQSQATLYTEARSPSTWTLPSHKSIFTGLRVPEHGIVNSSSRLKPGNTVWDMLGEEGYETGLFSSNAYLTGMDTGLADDFDHVVAEPAPPFGGSSPSEYFDTDQRVNFLRFCLQTGTPFRTLANTFSAFLTSQAPDIVPERFRHRIASIGSRYVDSFLNWIDGIGP